MARIHLPKDPEKEAKKRFVVLCSITAILAGVLLFLVIRLEQQENTNIQRMFDVMYRTHSQDLAVSAANAKNANQALLGQAETICAKVKVENVPTAGCAQALVARALRQ